MQTHKDLEVWKKSIDFVTALYKHTEKFPKEELYGLTSQLKRSSVSVPSNIAEGAARNTNKEYINFLYIALGSAVEIDTQLLIAKNLGFISEDSFYSLSKENEAVIKMIKGLIKYRKNK